MGGLGGRPPQRNRACANWRVFLSFVHCVLRPASHVHCAQYVPLRSAPRPLFRALPFPRAGPHDALDQWRGLVEFEALWRPEGVVVVVDDFQRRDVQRSTEAALHLLAGPSFGWEILLASACHEAPSGEGPSGGRAVQRDANGIYVLRKKVPR